MDDQKEVNEQRRDLNQEALDGIYGSKEDQAKEAEAERRLNSLYINTFSTESGAALLTHMDELFGQISHTPGDPYHTAYREGQRSVVLHIKQIINQANEGDI